AVRKKSEQLTTYAVELSDERLAPHGVTVVSPRDPARRGGHVTVHHPQMQEVVRALWTRDVIPDYRDPGGLRIGLSPLSTSFDELERGLDAIREVIDELCPGRNSGRDRTKGGQGLPGTGRRRRGPGGGLRGARTLRRDVRHRAGRLLVAATDPGGARGGRR